MATITYLGKSFETSVYSGTVYPDIAAQIREEFYPEYSLADVQRQLYEILYRNGNDTGIINAYYFARLMGDVGLDRAAYTINEILQSDEWCSWMWEYIQRKPKVFPPSDPLIKNVHALMRIGMSAYTGKITNFPFAECKRLLLKYRAHKTNLYIDTSCGWGVRMMAAAAVGLDYVGFDVNPPLIENLNRLGREIQKLKPNWQFEVIPHGSEYLEERLIGKADIMLTSPPYFILEDYRKGEQSCRPDTDYQAWVESFLKPTLDNSFQYAAPDTCVLFNIKDYKKYPMETDSVNHAKARGWIVSKDTLSNSARVTKRRGEHNINSADENVFVFHRHELSKPASSLGDMF